MRRVLIQAGHSALFAPYAQNGGGAPGEAAWAGRLANALAERLRTRGVEVVLVGAWLVYRNGTTVEVAAPTEAAGTYDLALSLHYDASGVYAQNTGCFADRWTYDTRAADADRFIAIWEALYPAATGIPLHNERRNPNSALYYAYKAVPVPPMVLLEHGIGQGDDHALLYDHLDLVAATDALAITQFLGLEDEDDVSLRDDLQRVTAERDTLNGINTELQHQIDALREEIGTKDSQLGALTHDVIQPLQDQLDQLRRALDLAGHRSAREVVVVLDDGTSQRFAPALNGSGGGG